MDKGMHTRRLKFTIRKWGYLFCEEAGPAREGEAAVATHANYISLRSSGKPMKGYSG